MLNQINSLKMSIVENGGIASPQGFSAAGLHCGLKRKRKDLGLILSKVPASSAAVYTMNSFQAAPLKVTKQSLSHPYLQALVVNSGNANAYTGQRGIEDALSMQFMIAEEYGVAPNSVAVASTGVIGEYMPMDTVIKGIPHLKDALSDQDSTSFAEAILTTDTFIKSLAVEIEIEGKKVTIGGVAKGSGMIHPNMATMLAFMTTDANIEPEPLQNLLKEVTNQTFNMITVDGDTSTNDMVLVMANGLADHQPLDETHPQWPVFYNAFHYVSQELAKMIARDGEGATRLVTVNVEGASSQDMAQSIAKKIVGSNLVKTAIFGGDGNWGRIIMAIGNSGHFVDAESIDIMIDDIPILLMGRPGKINEEEVTKKLQQDNVLISVHLHLGEESSTAWGCDLSYDYVRINASYRT